MFLTKPYNAIKLIKKINKKRLKYYIIIYILKIYSNTKNEILGQERLDCDNPPKKQRLFKIVLYVLNFLNVTAKKYKQAVNKKVLSEHKKLFY